MAHWLIDIHTHILPAVDDGAEDQNMSLLMLLRAKEQGITHIFATPHSSAFDEHPQQTLDAFQDLRRKAAQLLPEIHLYLGCEVYCEADRMPEVLEKLRSGEYPTMNGTKYVLMEFSRWVQPDAAVPCVKTLVEAGYIPIIAHMGHYRHLQNNMQLVQQFRELGAKIQLNVGSLFDEMDESTKAWAKRLVLERKVDFLGTDAHRTYYRPPSAEMGLKWLYENTECAYAEAIAFENAEQLLCRREEHDCTRNRIDS